MKKKYVGALLALGILSLTACGKEEATGNTAACTCTCDACAACEYKTDGEGTKPSVEDAEDVFAQETTPESESIAETETQETTEAPNTEETAPPAEDKPAAELSDGEKAARKEYQASLAAYRETLYSEPSSLEKTQKINAVDKEIIANNAFDFSTKRIQFLGDSVTEGICGAVDEDGNYISYVNYINDYLKFNACMNNGKAGRMFSDYAGPELSFSMDMGNMFNNSADIAVVYLGINDYLTARENKRYGDYNGGESTAGYVGAIKYVMKQLKATYSNQEVFFVTTYNVAKTANSTYTDIAVAPELADYMDMLRKIVKDNGYHLIELYDTGFMDCTDGATSSAYTADGLHPSDSGNKVLGEHIAAELALYYTQKQ